MHMKNGITYFRSVSTFNNITIHILLFIADFLMVLKGVIVTHNKGT